MNDFVKSFKETLRAMELIDFLGQLDKNKTELLVEFLYIKPEKINPILTALKAKKETQKTLENFLKEMGEEE